MPDRVIRTLATDAELRAVWPLVAQLRPGFDEQRFVSQMQRQIAEGCRATRCSMATASRARSPAGG